MPYLSIIASKKKISTGGGYCVAKYYQRLGLFGNSAG